VNRQGASESRKSSHHPLLSSPHYSTAILDTCWLLLLLLFSWWPVSVANKHQNNTARRRVGLLLFPSLTLFVAGINMVSTDSAGGARETRAFEDPPPEQEHATLTGIIVRRRCMGRFLAFCDVRLEESTTTTTTTIVSTVFRHQNLVNSKEWCSSFPTKKAMLPFGGRVALTGFHQSNKWEVTAWKLLSSPHDDAMKQSAVENGAGISCTDYFRSRREAFDAVTAAAADGNVRPAAGKSSKRNEKRTNSLTAMKNGIKEHHGNRTDKAVRAKVFAAWIMEHLMSSSDSSNTNRILDVAGGKGELAVELASNTKHHGTHCTTLDPVQRRRRRTKHSDGVDFVTGYFYNVTKNDQQTPLTSVVDITELIHQHTILVGLHPDQCTEDILDVALQHNKSVAIVPCCVFPDLFSKRRVDGAPVRTYEQFLQYLLKKDDRLQQTRLPFEGKNECIYLKVVDDGAVS